MGEPTEVRDLESLHGNSTVVRTTHDHDKSIVSFKNKYSLVDTSGHAISEPFEDDLQQISIYRKMVTYGFGACHTLVSLIVFGYAIFRFYIYSCYRQFTALTIADLKQETFPISDFHLHRLVQSCEHEYGGTGVQHGISCRPSTQQILETCEHVPPLQPRPTAFTHVVNEMFASEIEGAKCFEGLCEFRSKLVEWDHTIAFGCILLVLATFFLRCILNECIRSKKAGIQRLRAQELKTSRQKQTGYPLLEED